MTPLADAWETTPPQVTDPPLVEVADLSHTVAGRALLAGVSLHLSRGELLAVLGRNGAGKTTLLRHLSGELGSQGVRLFGRPPHAQAPAPLARRRAVLPQSTPLSFAHEVLDVVLLGRIPHGRTESAADREVAATCLARVGLGGYETRDILTLSGGEQQRVHLARTLAQLHGSSPGRPRASTRSPSTPFLASWLTPPPMGQLRPGRDPLRMFLSS